MSNLSFFKTCMANEFSASLALIQACPTDRLDYRPHAVNRSAHELIEHIVAHVLDLKIILLNDRCDETLTYAFTSSSDAADHLRALWKEVDGILDTYSEVAWEKESVELLVHGKSFVTLPRTQMMWFFFFDIIHHRGQLSSYVRPMGGKNPAVYGYSADTL